MSGSPQMSDRARLLFGQYCGVLRSMTKDDPDEERKAKADCLFLLDRLKGTYGHVEHEILADEMDAFIREATPAAIRRGDNPDA